MNTERDRRSGKTLEFRPGSTVRVGRVCGNDVVIKDPGISSKHLAIGFDYWKWLVQDLDSSNGTRINLMPIRLLGASSFDNDTIELGEFSLMLVRVQEQMRERWLRRGVAEAREAMIDQMTSNVEPVC